MNKKAQILGIQFSMIFSIILIIAFIAVAIYAIIMFLNIQKCSNIGLFKDDLQKEINRAWAGDEASFFYDYDLPGSIDEVCFIDSSSNFAGNNKEQYDKIKKLGYVNINLFFYLTNTGCESIFELEHIDIEKITIDENPYCVSSQGKLKIEKNFGESLVSLK